MFPTRAVEKIKTHSMYNNIFSENRSFNGVVWKKKVQSDRPQMTI